MGTNEVRKHGRRIEDAQICSDVIRLNQRFVLERWNIQIKIFGFTRLYQALPALTGPDGSRVWRSTRQITSALVTTEPFCMECLST